MRTPQAAPPQLAVDTVDPDERLRAECRGFAHQRVLNRKAQARQKKKRHRSEMDRAAQGSLESLLETLPVEFDVEERREKPSGREQRAEGDEELASAMSATESHERTNLKVRRQRVLVKK